MEEKREHPRKDGEISVEYTADGKDFRGKIKNISEGGIFIELEEETSPFVVGQEILLNNPVSSDKIIPEVASERNVFSNYQKFIENVPCEVVRSSSQEIGLRFKIKDKKEESIIKKIVEKLFHHS